MDVTTNITITVTVQSAIRPVYYIDATLGANTNTGTSLNNPWRTLSRVDDVSLNPGDMILLKRGESWDETLKIKDDGNIGDAITIDAYGRGGDPVIYALYLAGNYTTVQNITVDHNRASSYGVRIDGGHNCVLRNMTVRNGGWNGIQALDADGLLIDTCLVHHFLAGSFTNQADAHGISAEDTQGLTIRATEVHHVSGDLFQTDPDRDTDTPDNILIEACYFWTGPLQAKFNAWNIGETPGENAIDTKMGKYNSSSIKRMQITVRGVIAHGFTNSKFISNRAIFNMKDKIEAVFDGVEVYDSEIAFWLRGGRGNANVTIINTVIHNVGKAIRAEDGLANLRIYNSTFGHNIGQTFEIVAGDQSKTWDVKNNVSMGRRRIR